MLLQVPTSREVCARVSAVMTLFDYSAVTKNPP